MALSGVPENHREELHYLHPNISTVERRKLIRKQTMFGKSGVSVFMAGPHVAIQGILRKQREE